MKGSSSLQYSRGSWGTVSETSLQRRQWHRYRPSLLSSSLMGKKLNIHSTSNQYIKFTTRDKKTGENVIGVPCLPMTYLPNWPKKLLQLTWQGTWPQRPVEAEWPWTLASLWCQPPNEWVSLTQRPGFAPSLCEMWTLTKVHPHLVRVTVRTRIWPQYASI